MNLDKHLDAILKASGSALKHYSMQKTLDDMRAALQNAINEGQIEIGKELVELRDSTDRLTRELNVALNGERANKQTSLYDILVQVKNEQWKLHKVKSYCVTDDDENVEHFGMDLEYARTIIETEEIEGATVWAEIEL